MKSADDMRADACGRVGSTNVTGFLVREYRLWRDYTLPAHAHGRTGVVVVSSGRFTAEIDGIPYDVEPGRALVLPAGETHCETVGAEGASCFLIEPEASEASPLGPEPDPWVLRHAGLKPLAERLSKCVAEILRNPDADVEAPAADLRNLLAGWPRRKRPALPEWLQAAHDAARTSPERWSVRGLARSVGVAPETLSRRFVEFFGTTPSECLRAGRLEKAAIRLRNAAEPITSIAYSLGFTDQSHLTTTFGRRFGVTPGQYRKAL